MVLYVVLVDGEPRFEGTFAECQRYRDAYYKHHIDARIVNALMWV